MERHTLPYITERSALPYITDTVHPTLYHTHGPPYPTSQTLFTLPYIMERFALLYVTDTVHPTLYHGSARPTLYHTHGPPYPILCNGPCYPLSQTRSTLPCKMERSALPYITDTVHPTLYHRRGPPYPIPQTRSTIPYNIERLSLDTVCPTLPCKNFACFFLSHSCHMSCSSCPLWHNDPNIGTEPPNMRFLIMHFFQSPVIPSSLYPKMLFSALEIIDCKKQRHFRSMNWI